MLACLSVTLVCVGLPMRSVLQASSMMTKLWSSLMPSVIKGSSEAEDAPVSVALHVFDGMEIALALCRDLYLRVWSCQVKVLSHHSSLSPSFLPLSIHLSLT